MRKRKLPRSGFFFVENDPDETAQGRITPLVISLQTVLQVRNGDSDCLGDNRVDLLC